MSDTLTCPFCFVPNKPIPRDFDNQHQFNCPNCGEFLIYDAVYRRMVDRGEYADRKAELLQFIRQTPEDRIAYIGSKVEDGLYAEYRPLKES